MNWWRKVPIHVWKIPDVEKLKNVRLRLKPGAHYAMTRCDRSDILVEAIRRCWDVSIPQGRAPAGFNRGVLHRIRRDWYDEFGGVLYKDGNLAEFSGKDREALYQLGINPIRATDPYSTFVIWGARFVGLDGKADQIVPFRDPLSHSGEPGINPKLVKFASGELPL